LLFAAVEGSFRINMPPYHDKMLAVLKGAGIACVEWRMFYNNDEGDLDSIIATFSDGSRGPLPEVAVEDNIYVILWDLADDERIGGMGAWTNGLYVLDVNERSVARTADVFYDYDRQFDDTNVSWKSGGTSTSTGTVRENFRSGRSYGSAGSVRNLTKRRSRGSKRRR
jgi:hypothetical protein